MNIDSLVSELVCWSVRETTAQRGEEQNREEGEMAQKKLEGGRNKGKK